MTLETSADVAILDEQLEVSVLSSLQSFYEVSEQRCPLDIRIIESVQAVFGISVVTPSLSRRLSRDCYSKANTGTTGITRLSVRMCPKCVLPRGLPSETEWTAEVNRTISVQTIGCQCTANPTSPLIPSAGSAVVSSENDLALANVL